MKLFKKIPIEGYENYEINEDGWVLNTVSGNLQKLDVSKLEYEGEFYKFLEVIKEMFKNHEI